MFGRLFFTSLAHSRTLTLALYSLDRICSRCSGMSVETIYLFVPMTNEDDNTVVDVVVVVAVIGTDVYFSFPLLIFSRGPTEPYTFLVSMLLSF